MTTASAFDDCGTYAAYQRHKKLGIPVDEACRTANAEYMHEYRANHPTRRDQERQISRARARAMTRLARMYPGDFRRLFAEERRNPTTSGPDATATAHPEKTLTRSTSTSGPEPHHGGVS